VTKIGLTGRGGGARPSGGRQAARGAVGRVADAGRAAVREPSGGGRWEAGAGRAARGAVERREVGPSGGGGRWRAVGGGRRAGGCARAVGR
jgi:hypothetical protein